MFIVNNLIINVIFDCAKAERERREAARVLKQAGIISEWQPG